MTAYGDRLRAGEYLDPSKKKAEPKAEAKAPAKAAAPKAPASKK